MCIFSGRVRSVSNTNIFARLSGRGTQFLIYSMKYSSDRPVAMILPLPVAEPAKRLGIRFVNLKPYGDFFNDMENGFPNLAVSARSVGLTGGAAPPMARPVIHVESVGDFIASYVPTLDDFDRIDRRFRLPRSIWNQIPVYHDYGFAVFQLKDTVAKEASGRRGSSGIVSGGGGIEIGTGISDGIETMRVHPMAFEFHTRFADALYFPTVHIHDEHVHRTEYFDHGLYMQDPRLRRGGPPAQLSGPIASHIAKLPLGDSSFGSLRVSNAQAGSFIECGKTQGAVASSQQCYKLNLSGDLPNKDTLIRVG